MQSSSSPTVTYIRRKNTLAREGISSITKSNKLQNKVKNIINESTNDIKTNNNTNNHSINISILRNEIDHDTPNQDITSIKPINSNHRDENEIAKTCKQQIRSSNNSHNPTNNNISINNKQEKLKLLQSKYDYKIVNLIMNDIVQNNLGVSFEDIAGNLIPKQILNEAVVLPLIIPEFFTGIRQPWKV